MSFKSEFTLYSEEATGLTSLYATISIFIIMGIIFIVSGTSKGTAAGGALIAVAFLLMLRGSYKVRVSDSSFLVLRLFSQKRIAFEQVECIYKNREGFRPIYIYVVKFTDENKNRIRKITFDATKLEIEEVMRRLGKIRPDLVLTTRE